MVKTFKTLAVKPTACLVQKLKVRHHRHNVFVVFPLSADVEVTKHLAGYVGFEWLFDARAEAIFSATKLRGPRRNVEQAKALQVAEESLIGREMRDKTP